MKPATHVYNMGFYLWIYAKYGITYLVSADVLFLFEIDHDNSIETGVLNHYITATQEQSNICSINHVDII